MKEFPHFRYCVLRNIRINSNTKGATFYEPVSQYSMEILISVDLIAYYHSSVVEGIGHKCEILPKSYN